MFVNRSFITVYWFNLCSVLILVALLLTRSQFSVISAGVVKALKEYLQEEAVKEAKRIVNLKSIGTMTENDFHNVNDGVNVTESETGSGTMPVCVNCGSYDIVNVHAEKE